MSIITITTDLGYRDPYLAMVKGLLYQKLPQTPIIDLACSVKPHAHSEGAFALRSALPFFADDTIHLFAIKFLNSSDTITNLSVDNTRYLLTKYKNQYLISPDNGLFTLIDKNFSEPVFQLMFEDEKNHPFYLRDIFTGIAVNIVNGVAFEEFAIQTQEYCKLYAFESFATPSNLQGSVLYEDDFGNLITSITKKEFEENVGKKRFVLQLPAGKIEKIHTTYDDVNIGDVVAFFNSMDLLEISSVGQSATKIVFNKQVLSRYKIDKIVIDIYD